MDGILDRIIERFSTHKFGELMPSIDKAETEIGGQGTQRIKLLVANPGGDPNFTYGQAQLCLVAMKEWMTKESEERRGFSVVLQGLPLNFIGLIAWDKVPGRLEDNAGVAWA